MVKQYGHVLSTYFYFDLFKSPYECYNIWMKLADKFAVANCFPSTFGPFTDHHWGMCVLSNQVLGKQLATANSSGYCNTYMVT